ncbi:PTS sugar transporter subunit IIA [Abyssisolibacter fermentans]|uniref:PTS sugar transporter subunit IIA n=1 Tax=Abyssisolibacter fermentans TaxID=1766203 RepID=UPI0008342420|nr:hypothetical protein [Abyssisolibacter fermentans]
MKKFILASHGNLAAGILDSAQMIIGKQENVSVFSLKQGEHPQDIADEIKKMILASPNDDFIIATDIMGGSVQQALSQLVKLDHVYLVTGMNLLMVLELFSMGDEESAPEKIRNIVEDVKKSIAFTNDQFEQNKNKGDEDEWLNC